MKFQIASDLHLEWFKTESVIESFIDKLLNHNEADEIILPGDLGHDYHYGLINECLKKYNKTGYYVLGNHEYYGNHIDDPEISNYSNLHSLTKMINNGHVWMTGDTMWTDLPGWYDPGNYVNDIKYIKGFSKERWQQEHNKFLNDYNTLLRKPQIDLMVTHHAPSYKSVPSRFIGSPANYCFTTDMEKYMNGVKLWVHGHTHDSFDYMINDTRVVCNPFGYYGFEENPNFDYKKIVELC